MSRLYLIQQLKKQQLSVGILSTNWLYLNESLTMLSAHHLNILHFDIADGHFCPLFTVGTAAIKFFPTTYFKDVHLLVQDQFKIAKLAVSHGANLITLQLEQEADLDLTIEWLFTQNSTYLDKEYPILIGISLCPETPISKVIPYLDRIDVIQLLTLDPRTGKKYAFEYIREKIFELKALLGDKSSEKLINIDGSMTLELANSFRQLKLIDWIVSGTALFSGELDKNLKDWKKQNIF